jgi:protein-L-isoaspartate(D-aspartate) O-methyltransferase
MQELIDSMIIAGTLHTPAIIDAFYKIDRKYFVPEAFSEFTYIDRPLPIGKDQTISQPSTVAFMLEQLSVKEGNKVLDIGSGSGWTTSLLCTVVGEEGSVTGVERVDALVVQGRKNLEQFSFGERCHIQKAGDKLGVPGRTFDRILVSASAKKIPYELFEQLKIGGVLVIPVQNSIFKFTKLSSGDIQKEEFPGFVFVPLITD